MNRFVTATIKVKNEAAQNYQPISLMLSIDAILLFKEINDSSFLITIKPEYELRIKFAVGIHQNASIEYIKVPAQERAKLFE